MFLKRFFPSLNIATRNFQEDLDLYQALMLVKLKNERSEDVDAFSALFEKEGRLSWARLLRAELKVQIDPIMDHVAAMGGQDAYPIPKEKKQKTVTSGTLLERTLDYKGRDLDIEEKPVAHPTDGWKMMVARSNVQHREAGFGVVVEGFVPAGAVVCIYPGRLWWPSTYQGPLGNEYAVSRFDGVIVDALDWDLRARESAMRQHANIEGGLRTISTDERYRNPFALGSFVNHPPPSVMPNVMKVAYDFPMTTPFVPHEISSKKRPFFMMDSFLETTPSLLLVALRNLKDEELFLNYRFNPALPYPDWYTQPDLEEAVRRWSNYKYFGN